MSTEEQKPAVTTDAGVVEPTPAPAGALTAETVEPKVEPVAEAPAKTEGEAAAPVEEKKEEKKEEDKVEEEPIHSGALGYKAPGLKNAFRFNKKYFWFSEEPVSVQSLSHYLRGEKAEVAHPTAAWSNQTGKGLVYFVKHADEKAAPAGVLNLSEATDLIKDGTVAFSLKLHGHKHTFEAATLKERNGWFIAFERAIEEGKAAKEEIVSSESYKEELAKLGKPAALAASTGSAPKKSIDATPKLAEAGDSTAEAAQPARAGSSSSSSSDEEKKKKKASKSKSRSVSRGKRASIFGGFLGKKDKAEEKVEEKKEEKKEEADAKESEAPAAAPATETTTVVDPVAPVIPPVETAKPIEEPKVEETTALPAAVPAAEEPKAEEKKPEEKKVEEKPKPSKRGSIFGSFVEKLKSPTHEKKESEVVPAAPLKEAETATAVPKVEEEPAVAAAPVADVTTEPKAEEVKPVEPKAATPNKERQHFSFGKFLGGAKEKVRSPSGEKAPELPKAEEPAKTEEAAAPAATTEAAIAAPVEPAAEAPKEEEKVEAPATTPAPKAKRGSVFGNLLRHASKAGKSSKKEKEEPVAPATPAKVEETAEPKEEEKKEETLVAPATATEPATIGDVVPDAVQVGQAPKSTPQVATSA